jgi:hypothetical protein
MQLNNDQSELNNENFPRLFPPIDLCGQEAFQKVAVHLCEQFHRKTENLQPIH